MTALGIVIAVVCLLVALATAYYLSGVDDD